MEWNGKQTYKLLCIKILGTWNTYVMQWLRNMNDEKVFFAGKVIC